MNEDLKSLGHQLNKWIAKSSESWDEEHFEWLKNTFGPNLKKPIPEEFGLDSNNLLEAQVAHDYNQRAMTHNRKMTNFFSPKTFWGLLPIIGPLTEDAIFDKKLNPLGEKYANYLKKLNEYNEADIPGMIEKMRILEIKKKEAGYWFSLDGWKFEEEVSQLFRASGYFSNVTKTKGSGDGGIDLILTANDGSKLLVQCKAHKGAVGPHVARDLYGAMQAAGISKGLIISLGGVTQGVRDFIKGKDISIIDVGGVIKLQKMIQNKSSN